MLSRKVLLFSVLCFAIVAINARPVSDDLEVAASGKDEEKEKDQDEEWKKGGGKDNFEKEESADGEKGKKRFLARKLKT